jgi:PAS domain S-box-containing protein
MLNPDRVLLVDDEPMLLALTGRRLRDKGFDVETCSSGEEALRRIEGEPDRFGIVLLDVMMPGLDGIETLQQIRALDQGAYLPVVMLTARDDPQTTLRALRCGANDYVSKPPDLGILFARMNVHLRLSRALVDLRASEERYSLAAEGANDGLWDWDVVDDRFRAARRWWGTLGLSRVEEGGIALWMDRVHPDDRRRVEQALDRHLKGRMPRLRVEHRLRGANDQWRWVLVRGSCRRTDQGDAVRMAGSITDLSEGRLHDPRTGLPRRDLLVDRIRASIEAPEGGLRTAVISARLEGLEAVARAFGTGAVDGVLAEVAGRLQDAVDDGGRAVLLRGAGHVTPSELAAVVACRREEDAVRAAQRILDALSRSIVLSDKTVRARPRVGVAIADPGEDIPAVDLLDRASAALARTTEGRRRSPTLYDPERHAAVTRRLQLETDLCDALRDGSLHVEYQPVVGLPHGNAVGVEALVRWNHPERGPLPPDEFVPLAEETGLIGALGAFVLEHACDQAAAWRAAGRAVHLAVNVSALEVADPEWVPRLRTILQRSGLPPTDLIIELTEGVFVQDPETVGATLEAVRQLGVRVALDDFGTGYASLSYLRSLPFDLLKIDRSFVAGLPGSDEDAALVEGTLAMAARFGLQVVAEGVETQAQADTLAAMGCQLAQGWHFGRPTSGDAVLNEGAQATVGADLRV